MSFLMERSQPEFHPVGNIYLLLGLAQAAHSIEEMRTHLYEFFWTATGRLHSSFPSFPQFRMEADTFAAINMALIALLLATVPFVRTGRRWALFLAAVVGTIEILNGAAHLTGVVVFRGYVPGAASAPLLFLLGCFLLRELRRTPFSKR
ncbi:MAG: HXXEE domain-containing protein [Candidatus Acidoferrales bacterium]